MDTPFALIGGRDIVQALRAAGHTAVPSVTAWLRQFSTEIPG
jgi:hypothetical protein